MKSDEKHCPLNPVCVFYGTEKCPSSPFNKKEETVELVERKEHGSVFVDGIEVIWDEDHDERVIPVARALKAGLVYRGLPSDLIEAVQEHEGTLTLWIREGWNQFFPYSLYYEKAVKELIVKLVGELCDLITCDYWSTFFGDEL